MKTSLKTHLETSEKCDSRLKNHARNVDKVIKFKDFFKHVQKPEKQTLKLKAFNMFSFHTPKASHVHQ
jgi:hypothetical protein